MLFWNVGDASPDATVGRGARLLIRDLMCFVPVCSSSYLLVSLLLSAVVGIMAQLVVCGVGISRSFVVRMVLSVLDYLV